MDENRNWFSQRAPIRLQPAPPRLSELDMDKRVGPKKYRRKLAGLQERLREVSLAYRAQHRRAVVLFEGWDAAGKGGVIRRMSWPLDPRGLKVWPIAAPTPDEQGQHYLYRFWKRLPRPGQMVIFDRSWYGRVLVERVEGFAAESEWSRAYSEINEFERMLDDDGIRLVKIFLHITPEEQLERFRQRWGDPLKRWKLSAEDLRNRSRWSEYEAAIEDMFQKTSTVPQPWVAVPANHKKYARLAAMRAVVKRLADAVDTAPPGPAPEVEGEARRMLGVEQDGRGR